MPKISSAVTTSSISGDPDLQENRNAELREKLLSSLREHTALPFLFLGSGISRRYLGLPDWEGMLRHFSDDIGKDLDFYLASTNNNMPKAATELAKDFHHAWWGERRYAKQRKEFKSTVRDDEGGFKVAVAEYFRIRSELHPGVPGVDNAQYVKEIDRLREAVVDGVITTNYDQLAEQIFPQFPVYVGQDDLLLSDAQFVAETYKIHGSCESAASLVLTAKDYEDYQARNSYLAAKLLTIFAEHPVIFIGYSMNDLYIREIIDSIARAVGPARLDALQRQIYFVEWNQDPNSAPSLSPYFFEVMQGQAIPAQKIDTNSFMPIFDALASLQRPFPAHLLRELRKHVYELVAHPDPGQAIETVRAIPFDSENTDGLRVVFGVGSFSEKDLQDISGISGRTLTREDLARDLLDIRPRGIDAHNVIQHGLPTILKYSATAYLPIFKYLHECGAIDNFNEINETEIPDTVKDLIKRIPTASKQNQARYSRVVAGKFKTPREVFEADFAVYFKFECLLCLDSNNYDIEEMRQVLAEQLELSENGETNSRTNLFKAIAHYDRMKYAVGTPYIFSFGNIV